MGTMCCKDANLAVAVVGPQDLVKWLAVNQDKENASGGAHKAKMNASEVGVLYCSATVAIRTQRQTGAFVWWIVNPKMSQLQQLSSEQDWSNRWGKDLGGKTTRAKKGEDSASLVWLADMKLTQNVPSATWAQIKDNPKVLETATFTYANNLDLSKTKPIGWATGTYRVDFYLGESGDGRQNCRNPAGEMAEDGSELVINKKEGEKYFFAGTETIRQSITFEIVNGHNSSENGVATPEGIAMAI